MTAVLRRQSRSIEIQNIARFGGRIRPRISRYRQQLAFEACLPLAKVSCVALDLRQRAPEVGRFLSGHATVLVEIERFVSHRARLRRSAAHRTDRPSRSISS